MLAAILGVLMTGVPAAAPARTPVFVELFSSEGCSSCPPADAVLRRLDAEQPIPGAQVIALELHVDYWNRLGWTDPFSRREYTVRQSQYAQAFAQDGVYTPQLVIDGAHELVGSREGRARELIAEAAQQPHASIHLAASGDTLKVEVPPSPQIVHAEVWLAVTERGLATDVKSGENAGEHLAHGPVVRSLTRIGIADAKGFRSEGVLKLAPGESRANASAVVFLQDPTSRRILGAAALALSR